VRYAILADLVVAFHVVYVAFVVLGQVGILIGLALRWRGVRNPWFRILHLIAIVIVGLEAVLGVTCPLTSWENNLRQWAGQSVEQGSFMGRLFHNLLFYDCDQRYFDTGHICFAVLVVATFLLAPPEWRRWSNPEGTSE
jgi:hypothetical protein